MSIIKLVVSTLRTNLQVNLMLWEMWIQSKRRKKKKGKPVQLASNNDLYFLSPTEIFWVPHENGKQRFFILLDLLEHGFLNAIHSGS